MEVSLVPNACLGIQGRRDVSCRVCPGGSRAPPRIGSCARRRRKIHARKWFRVVFGMPGMFKANASECAFRAHKVSRAPPDQSRVPGADGEFTHGNGSVSCSKCIPGMFKANASEVCIPCPQGFVNAAKAATFCSVRTRKVRDGDGSTSCSECILGMFKANASEVCIPCPQGFVNAAKAATSCSVCGPGRFATENGSTSCSECIPEMFKANASEVCIPCPQGFVNAAKAATSCSVCGPEGSRRRTGYAVSELQARRFKSAGSHPLVSRLPVWICHRNGRPNSVHSLRARELHDRECMSACVMWNRQVWRTRGRAPTAAGTFQDEKKMTTASCAQ